MKITLTIDVPGGREDADKNMTVIRGAVSDALIEQIRFQTETAEKLVLDLEDNALARISCQAIYP